MAQTSMQGAIHNDMSTSYGSFLNILRSQRNDLLSIRSGQTGNDDYPCLDDVENSKLDTLSDEEEITVFSDLPPKPVGREGMINNGIIVGVVSPGEFYLFPLRSWECACKEGNEESGAGQASHSNFRSGSGEAEETNRQTYIEDFNKMLSELTAYGNRGGGRSAHYAKDQLVAVKMGTKTGKGESNFWFRGVMLEDPHVEANSSTATALVRLLDVGTCVEKSLNDIAMLPRSFCHAPPMSYKCTLFGVSPVSHRWTKTAISTFKLMAEFQPCVYEMKRTIPVDASGPPRLFENEPYEMEIHVKIEGTFYNAAHSLASEGLAVKWNLTPSRPMVAATLDGELWNLLAAEDGKPGCSLHSHVLKPDNQNVITREMNRMEKLLGRLSVDVDCDDDDDGSMVSIKAQSHSSSADDVMFK